MKDKTYKDWREEPEIIFKHSLNNIQLGVDDTDHICFFCDDCHKPLRVVEVESKKIQIDFDENKDYCTWIWMICENCKTYGKRKFYWKTETGRYCWQKTNSWRKDNEKTET